MSFPHGIVWLDHRNATVIRFGPTRSTTVALHSDAPTTKLHRKSHSIGSGRTEDDHRFFDQIALALVDANSVLVAGPGTAKTAFVTYVNARHAGLARRIVRVETLDHPTEGQLLAFAQQSFKRMDLLSGT